MLPLLFAASLQAQISPQISIEHAEPNGPRGGSLGRDHIRAHGIPLDRLIAFAFQVDDWKIAGPQWIREARYDVRSNDEAPPVEGAVRVVGPRPDIRPALQAAMIEKFSLVCRRERRLQEAWVMRLPMKPPGRMTVSDAGRFGMPRVSKGSTYTQVVCKPCGLSDAINALGSALRLDIVDETGVNGMFEFSVMWTNDDPDSMIRAWREATGIELSREFVPIEVFVIDSAIRPDAPPPDPPRYVCEATREVRAALDALPSPEGCQVEPEKILAAHSQLAERYPNDVFIQMRLQDALRKMPQADAERKRARERYRRLNWPHLRDFLEARLTLAADHVESERLMLSIPEYAPEYPWARLALADWAKTHVPQDAERLERHVKEFVSLCPRSVAALGHARTARDPELRDSLRTAAGSALSTRVDSEAIATFPLYWNLLMSTGAEAARLKIRRDLPRLRFLNRLSDPAWVRTMTHGYGLLGDETSSRQLQKLTAAYLSCDGGTRTTPQ